ncbi:MAG: S8 family serine peptidase [Clostridia bacterium]|nr:S8 family serine peptidase [Clostridia bacterium]
MKPKKWLAILLTVVFLVSFVPAEALTPGAKTDGPDALTSFAGAYYAMKTTHAAASGQMNAAAPGDGLHGGTDEPVSDEPVSPVYDNARLILRADERPVSATATDVITDGDGLYILQYDTPAAAAAAEAALKKQENVLWVTPDAPVRTAGQYLSWGYEADAIDMNNYNGWLSGQNSNLPRVTVAVIDTGVAYDHPLLSGRVDTANDYDFVNGDADAYDDHFHGTHVAGTIVDGTLPNVKILPVKVLDENGGGSEADVYLGIRYAVEHGADVINMSLGGEGSSELYSEAVDDAVARGVIVVVAAGNDNQNAERFSPANVESAITVAAVTQSRERASFSNYGDLVDIAAPGVNIYSTVPHVTSVSGMSDYTYLDGTSMATPHVAAAAAGLKSYNKNINAAQAMNYFRAVALPVSSPKAIGCGMLCMKGVVSADAVRFSIDASSLRLYPGQQTTLSVHNETGSAVSWQTSNANVVTVNNGTLTAAGTGTADITVSAGGQRRVCKVEVSALSFTLEQSSVETYVALGTKIRYNLSHAVWPAWTSSNPDVVQVDPDGTVRATAAGQADVTAVVGEGTASRIARTLHITVREIGAWYVPNATEMTLSSARDLYEVGVAMHTKGTNFYGVTLRVDPALSSIDMAGFPEFLPIGYYSRAFMGVFDGSNVPVRNLHITVDAHAAVDGYRDFLGMFGYCYGTVKNVRLENVSVLGSAYAGGVCALLSGSGALVDGCYVSGSVTAQSNTAGGIVGTTQDGARVVNCENAAAVAVGDNQSGGISGIVMSGGKLENCLNRGTVTGACAAGITSGATSNFFLVMPIYADSAYGPYPAGSGAILNCVNVGSATNGIAQSTNAITVRDCYWLSGASTYGIRDVQFDSAGTVEQNVPAVYEFGTALTFVKNDKAYKVLDALNTFALARTAEDPGVPFVQWKTQNGLPALDRGVYTSNKAYIWLDDAELGMITGESRTLTIHSNVPGAAVTWTSSAPSVVSVNANGVVTALSGGAAEITASCGDQSATVRVLSLQAGAWYVRGASLLTITTAEELHELAGLVNAGIDDFTGKTVGIAADLDLSVYPNWEPIGSDGFAFCGVLDGQGHTLSGLTLTDAEYAAFALVGTLGGNGELKDIKLTNVDVDQCANFQAAGFVCLAEAGTRVTDCKALGGLIRCGEREAEFHSVAITPECGGIVGKNRGTVTGCVNNLTLSTKSIVRWGGVVGDNEGTVNGCVNNGAATGFGYFGGIAGVNNPGCTLVNCLNRGAIEKGAEYGDLYAAGVTPCTHGRILNCANLGNIIPRGSEGSGLVGQLLINNNYDLDNCVNEGTLGAGDIASVGGMYQGTIKNVYWRQQDGVPGVIFRSDNEALTNCYAYGDSRVLPTGVALTDALNARVREHNTGSPYDVRYANWSVGAFGEPTLETACAHETRVNVVLGQQNCFHGGLTGTVCADCGALLSKTDTPALGHDFQYWYTSTGTCVYTGYIAYKCSRCGEEKRTDLGWGDHYDPDNDGWCDYCGQELWEHPTPQPEPNLCPLCGEEHTGFFDGIVALFHRIIYFFKNLF